MGGCKSIFSKTSRTTMANKGEATIPKFVEDTDLSTIDVPSFPDDLKKEFIPKRLKDNEKYHAFISHSSEDVKISRRIAQILENQGFKCFHSDIHFIAGATAVTNITKGIDESMRMIALVSENMLQSDWVTFEVANSISKQQEKGVVTLIPVLCGISPDRVPPYIKETQYLELSDPNFWKKLCKLLTEDIRLADAIPFGNISHGISWSHYYGYLSQVLPGLNDRVNKSEYAAKKLLSKIITILPESCYCPDKIQDMDENIKPEGFIECKATRGGKLDRSYKSTVYKVTDPDDHQEYYALLECPKTLMVLYEMEKGRISGMDKMEMKRQALLFKEKMEEIVNHSHISECHNRAIFLQYKDRKSETESTKRLSRVIVDCIKEELKKVDVADDMKGLAISGKIEKEKLPVQETVDEVTDTEGEVSKLSALQTLPVEAMTGIELPTLSDDQYHVYISSHEDNRDVVRHISTQLKQNNFKVFFPEQDHDPGKSKFEGYMDKCQKVLTIISDEYLKDNMSQFEQHNAIIKGNMMEKCNANIPILHKLQSNEVPSYIKEVNYILTSDPEFWSRLVRAIVAKNIPLSASIPTHDIAGGLAYAYYYNYLRLVLPGLVSRLEVSDYKDKNLFKKFIILMPKSGKCPRLSNIDSNISIEKRVPYQISVAGAVNRDYSNSMSRVVNPDETDPKEVYVVMEIATPLLTLYEMEMGRTSGLSPDGKAKEMKDFTTKLLGILDHESNNDCRGLVTALTYDDQDPAMMSDAHYLSREVIKIVKEAEHAST